MYSPAGFHSSRPKVSISPEEMADCRRKMLSLPDLRGDKVDSARAAIAAGRYENERFIDVIIELLGAEVLDG